MPTSREETAMAVGVSSTPLTTPSISISDYSGKTSTLRARGPIEQTAASTTHPPILLLLNGFPGVGKYSIAKSLQQDLLSLSIPTKLIDNHSIIDLVIKSVVRRTPEYYAHRKVVLRSEFFDKYTDTTDMIVIMTACFANETLVDVDQWKDHVSIARERGFDFVHVTLSCDMEANSERITSVERIEGRKDGPYQKLKGICPERLNFLRTTSTMIEPTRHRDGNEDVILHHYDLDNTELSIEESVERLRVILQECEGKW